MAEKRKANEEIEKLPENEQDAAWDKFFATHRHDVPRLDLGRQADGSVSLALHVNNGRVRLALGVRPDGEPSLKFFNAEGKVTREFTTSN